MASATIDHETGMVKLELTLHEAAGLEALLVRVDHETNAWVNLSTEGVFLELNSVRDEALSDNRMARLWSHEFDEFRKNRRPLR